MNYYEHHLGDYAKDTAHLTMLEHGAYRLLLDRYYGTEHGIPSDQVHRVARARSRDEKAAVDAVLEEFFILVDGVWKNNRAEEEIKKFSDKKPKADEKRENDKERQRRARERRKALFEELSGLGINMPWNATTEQLQAEIERAKSHSGHGDVTEPVTRDNTATQSPVPSHQYLNPTSVVAGSSAPNPTDENPDDQPAPTRKGVVCGLLRRAGMADAAPHYLDDQVWETILAKRTDEEIVEVARAKMAARPGQRTGLKYIAPALLEDPQPITGNARASPPHPRRQTLTETRAETLAALTGRDRSHERQNADERDITSESVRIE